MANTFRSRFIMTPRFQNALVCAHFFASVLVSIVSREVRPHVQAGSRLRTNQGLALFVFEILYHR